jgi:putative peptide zinc metalloprotease protein
MDRPLHSSQWHRVAGLRPRWRLHARSDPQQVRGETWHVVSGDGRSALLRLDATAWAIAARCDGRRTLQSIWEAAVADDPDGAPTQDETIALLACLVDERCLACEGLPDVAVLLEADRRAATARLRARLNPLAPRLSLGDPTRLLAPLAPLGRVLFSRAGAAAWLALVAFATLVALADADGVARHAARWLDSPRYLLLGALVWVPMKALHELAHGLAVRRWGGEVRDAGIALMLLVPVPYLDASAAHRFASARARAAVGAAGILAETALAALGLLVWAATGPGWLHDAGFMTAVVGSLSTVLFNGNPLLRMDGYFVLCDAAGLPNLATRSGAWWQALAQRRLLGLRGVPGPVTARGERGWLLAYSPLAWAWRLTMLGTLALWAGTHHRLFGAVVAIAAIAWLALPLRTLWRAPAAAGAPLSTRLSARLRLGAVLAGLASLVLAVPLPDRTVAPALVWMPDDAQLRAGVEGFVVAVERAPQDAVRAGDTLLRLDDPALRGERARLQGTLAGLRAQYFTHLRTDPARAGQFGEDLARSLAELDRLDERLAQLVLRAPADGRFAIGLPEDLPGRFVREGELLGHLLAPDRVPVLRVALDQDQAARLREGVGRIDARLAEAPRDVLAARLLRQVPAAVEALPGAALGDRGGGTVPVDPLDRDGLKPAYPTYVVDVALDAATAGVARPGGRAWVRMDFGQASLATQGARWVRQTVRGRFAPDEL